MALSFMAVRYAAYLILLKLSTKYTFQINIKHDRIKPQPRRINDLQCDLANILYMYKSYEER